MLFGLERMQGELSEYAEGVRGHVRMHANISAIVQFLPEDLGHFARAHSQIKIDLQEHLSPEVLQAVQEGAADLGIPQPGQRQPGQRRRRTAKPPYRSDHWCSSCRKRMPRLRETANGLRCWTGTSSACMLAASAWRCAPPPRPGGHCASAYR